jgi:hypoxanthine phosphoribosyltransferase
MSKINLKEKKKKFLEDSRKKNKKVVTFDEYYSLVEQLASKIKKSGTIPTCIVSIPRGGNFIADTLSRLFEIPIAYLPFASYDDNKESSDGNVEHNREVARSFTNDEKFFKRPLIVDDLTQTNLTINLAKKVLNNRFGKYIEEIFTAVLWVKGEIKVDFYTSEIPLDQWIIQPFEIYGSRKNTEKITLDDL